MTETPVDPVTEVDNAPVQRPLPVDIWTFGRRQWIVICALALAALAVIVGATDLHSFGLVGGAAAALGLLAFATALLYSVMGSRTNARTLSRAPEAAMDALDALPDPCYLTDKRGAVIFANEAYLNLTGILNVERPTSLERLLAGREEVADALFRLAQAARTGFPNEEEVRISARSGPDRLYRVTVRPLSGEGGAVWHLRDLTPERERTEAAERESGRILSYVDHAPAGFFIAEQNGEIIYMNRTLSGWLGFEPERAAAHKLKLVDLVLGDIAGFGAGGDADVELPSLDVDLRKRDGGALSARVIQTRMQAVPGRPPLTCALVLNRVGQTKAEASMREAEMRFARFFNNAPIAIATVDASGHIDTANAAFLTYLGEGVSRGVDFAALVLEDDRAVVIDCLSRARRGVSGPPIDVRLMHRAERVAQLYASRIDGGNEESVEGGASAVIYLIDATEQKSLEMQFAQSQKMQAVGQLAGGVAHDFNNLLTAIIGFCDLLLARHQAGDPSFADVMQIKQNANRAANLTRQLLAFSRRQTLRPKVLSLTDALAELSNLLARLLTEKVELKIVHSRDLGLVKVDQNQLEQVIMNLAVNARDAMPDGGKLTIRTANVSEEDSRALDHALMPPAEYVLIEVSDTGVGIAKENLAKIFEPFYTTKDPSKGTGLGLSTVYGIVKQTGGFIFAYSTLGKGTSFRIYLPRYFETAEDVRAEAQEAAAAASAPEQAADLTGNGTVLLVEDEDAVRTFASRALATRGYEVLQAESGEAAIALVEEYKGHIDIIVSDVVMPNMDGPTMVKMLTAKLPHVKVIFVSGYAEDAFAKSLDPTQEFHFLPKPFSLKQLAAAVKDVMG